MIATAPETATRRRDRLFDGYGRRISYLRLSITDRCDLRCTYCMPERMTFLPRKDLLELDELERLAAAFVARGITKIRLTGGEPLVRRDAMSLIARLGRLIATGGGEPGLAELTLTTNGTQLARHAADLAKAGIRRINISLDTLNPDLFARLARRDVHKDVLAGIDAAQEAGLKVKINTVALKDVNEQEIPRLVEWAHEHGHDISLIEVMPLGAIEADRVDQYLPLGSVRAALAARYTLQPSLHATGGPARYFDIAETGGRIGFITPLTHNFCGSCNRIRVTATGQLFTCLGDEGRVDLRAALRSSDPDEDLSRALALAMRLKPERHHFAIERRGAEPAVRRHMSMTGG